MHAQWLKVTFYNPLIFSTCPSSFLLILTMSQLLFKPRRFSIKFFPEFFFSSREKLTLSSLFVVFCYSITVVENHKKVSFNIASEASFVYNLSGQKFIKNAKNGPFWRVFKNLKLTVKQCYPTGQF